MRAEGQWL